MIKRLDKDLKNKKKQTPLHYLIASNIIAKSDFLMETLNEDVLAVRID